MGLDDGAGDREAEPAPGADAGGAAVEGLEHEVAFLLLLNFSVITSRLSEETKILAQEVARLDAELRAKRGAGANGDQPASGEDEPEPSAARTADQ